MSRPLASPSLRASLHGPVRSIPERFDARKHTSTFGHLSEENNREFRVREPHIVCSVSWARPVDGCFLYWSLGCKCVIGSTGKITSGTRSDTPSLSVKTPCTARKGSMVCLSVADNTETRRRRKASDRLPYCTWCIFHMQLLYTIHGC